MSKKLVLFYKQYFNDPTHKEKRPNGCISKGKTLSAETRALISAARIGNTNNGTPVQLTDTLKNESYSFLSVLSAGNFLNGTAPLFRHALIKGQL